MSKPAKSNQAEKIVKGEKVNQSNPFQKNTLQNLLNRAIKFRKSHYVDHKLDAFKQKFAPVNGVSGVVHASSAYELTTVDNVLDKVDQNGFESPQKELFSKSKLSSGWNEIHPVGSGLKDLGNLSSLNAVLQILTYTPALANYMMERTHSPNCTIQDYCFVCAVEEHVRTALKGSPYALQPRVFVGKLKKLSNGTPKDAYDVWNYFMEQIQSYLLSEKRSKDKLIQETTALYQIFGGHLQKKLQCSACNQTENVYNSFLSLKLDLNQCSSVDKCLSNHFKRNISLTKECKNCQNEGELKGKQSVYKSPLSLVIQLERFSQDQDRTKINKFVKFEEFLEIKHNVSETEKEKINTRYELYGAIVHTGQSINDGRYMAYVKTSNGIWYCMDNENVRVVSVKRLLEEKPYMLFYTTPKKRVKKQAVEKTLSAVKPVEEKQEVEKEEEEEEEMEIVQQEVDSDAEEKEEERQKLQKAMEESAEKEKVINKNAIVIDYTENMKNKREKLNELIEKEALQSQSGEVKSVLLSKGTNEQFQDDINTWDEDASVEAKERSKVLKQLKAKRKKADLYDLEYDRGKVKKVKEKKEPVFNKPNAFQKAADKTNKKDYKNRKNSRK